MKTRECKCVLGRKFQICSGGLHQLLDAHHNYCDNMLPDGTRCGHDPACHEEVEISAPKSESTYEERLRDEFAMAALPSICAEAMRDEPQGSGPFQDDRWRICLALDAYAIADAMLQARKKEAK